MRGDWERLLLRLPQGLEARLGFGVAALPQMAGADHHFGQIGEADEQGFFFIQGFVCAIEGVAGLDEILALGGVRIEVMGCAADCLIVGA